MGEKKFYGMRNDYMFKAVLQKSESVLRNLIAALLQIDESEIATCEILNSIELGKSVDAKDCVLDVKVLLNSQEIIDLEVQVRNENNWPERSLLYWSRAYDDLKEGEEYRRLRKTYHIGILNFTLFEDNPSFYAEYKLMDTRTDKVYTDKINIRILDLTRINEASGEYDANLVKWAKVFKADTMKELEILAQEEEVMQTMVSHLRELSEDERLRQQLQAREDYERRLVGQYRQGIELGKEQGIELGKEQGIELGKEQGIELERRNMIDRLFKSGKTIAQIVDICGYDRDWVERVVSEENSEG